MSPTDVKRSQAKSTWRMEVDAGGCFIGDELIRCSLDKTHCQGLEFRSSRQMLLSLTPGDEKMRRSIQECMKPNANFAGMCTSPIDNYHCTGHASGCTISTKFVPNIPYCTLQYNTFPQRQQTHLTLFGKCDDDCVWSIDDCPNAGQGSSYMPAAFSTYGSMVGGNELCTCDKVKVGACVGKDPDNGDETYNCAVSADACDDESEFWSRSKLKQEKGNEFECYLCSPFDKAEVPTIAIGATETISASGNSINNKTTEDCTGGIAVGATVGALMGIFLVFAIQFLCCRRFHGSILDENENSSFNSEFDDSEEFDDCQDFVETTTTNNESKQLEEINLDEDEAAEDDDEQPGTMA